MREKWDEVNTTFEVIFVQQDVLLMRCCARFDLHMPINESDAGR